MPSTSPQPDQPVADPCCGGEGLAPGTGGAWVPKAGEQQVQACRLCPESKLYWRKHGSS